MCDWLQVLVGPPGVGRRALVHRIVAHNPKLFDTIKAGQYFTLFTKFQSCFEAWWKMMQLLYVSTYIREVSFGGKWEVCIIFLVCGKWGSCSVNDARGFSGYL